MTVGVDVLERSPEVLRAAAVAARRRGAVLHIVHTWDFVDAYYDLTLSEGVVEEWSKHADAEIQAAIDGLGDHMVGVTYRVDVRRGPAADALLDEEPAPELLVIGRHDPRVPLGSHLGPVARAVLREAVCPVLLVDPRPGRQA